MTKRSENKSERRSKTAFQNNRISIKTPSHPSWVLNEFMCVWRFNFTSIKSCNQWQAFYRFQLRKKKSLSHVNGIHAFDNEDKVNSIYNNANTIRTIVYKNDGHHCWPMTKFNTFISN